jgi:DNA-binding transcriptional MerR regulator
MNYDVPLFSVVKVLNSMQAQFSLKELAESTGLNPRTIRFYIDKGLVARPEGTRKNAIYTDSHLTQIQSVINWQKEGLTLDEMLAKRLVKTDLPASTSLSLSMWSRVEVAKGIEIHVDLLQAGLTQSQIEEMALWLKSKLKSQTNAHFA